MIFFGENAGGVYMRNEIGNAVREMWASLVWFSDEAPSIVSLICFTISTLGAILFFLELGLLLAMFMKIPEVIAGNVEATLISIVESVILTVLPLTVGVIVIRRKLKADPDYWKAD